MANTSIEWTDKTWNPTVGCSLVSPGCTNCYAMKMAERMKSMASKPDGSGNFHLDHYVGTTSRGPYNRKPVHWTGVVKVAPESTLLQPLKWKKPARIFVNSMSDLFHESVPDEVIDQVFAVMELCQQHTFQILTKRSKRMRKWWQATTSKIVGQSRRPTNLIKQSKQLGLKHPSPTSTSASAAKTRPATMSVNWI